MSEEEIIQEANITISSNVDIPPTYCPKCNALLPEGPGEKQCGSCSAKVNVKLPSLEYYYVLACKKIHDKYDINKNLLELID